MLRKIRSSYITKMIFQYISEKTKLNLIKYNKLLQKAIEIRLINYKIFSGKYIKFERAEYGEIYNAYSCKKIYEGEINNGERNGKGKEYNENDELIYEGEFLKGKRNGYGKDMGLGNTIYFQGEFKNGLKNGKGKEYNNGILTFEGEYKNGEMWEGKGEEYGYETVLFDVEYKNG